MKKEVVKIESIKKYKDKPYIVEEIDISDIEGEITSYLINVNEFEKLKIKALTTFGTYILTFQTINNKPHMWFINGFVELSKLDSDTISDRLSIKSILTLVDSFAENLKN